MIKQFTASTYIVHKQKVLLLMHKKLNMWFPVGGHMDPNELPEVAAMREAKEESGLDVKLYNPDIQIETADVKQLLRPMYILLQDINPSNHQHIDFVYYATSETDVLNPQNGETTNLKWFSAEEIKSLEGAPMNVKTLSLEAIKMLK